MAKKLFKKNVHMTFAKLGNISLVTMTISYRLEYLLHTWSSSDIADNEIVQHNHDKVTNKQNLNAQSESLKLSYCTI